MNTEVLVPFYSKHPTYYNAEGEVVPSVTTVLSLLGKDKFLMKWARNEAFKGNDYEQLSQEAGELLKKHDIDTQIEKLFYEVGKIAKKHGNLSDKLNSLLEKRFGTTYSDEDMDGWIDSLIYGQGEPLTEKDFNKFWNDMLEVSKKNPQPKGGE